MIFLYPQTILRCWFFLSKIKRDGSIWAHPITALTTDYTLTQHTMQTEYQRVKRNKTWASHLIRELLMRAEKWLPFLATNYPTVFEEANGTFDVFETDHLFAQRIASLLLLNELIQWLIFLHMNLQNILSHKDIHTLLNSTEILVSTWNNAGICKIWREDVSLRTIRFALKEK